MKRFYSLNDYFQDHFGEKIYKVSLDGGFTCPNRDGSIGIGGCIFCSEKGSGEFTGDRHKNIYQQIEEQLELISKKFPTGRVIAYFQNFTNTYADVDTLRKRYEEALTHPRVMGLAIATRPDCLGEEVLHLLEEFQQKTFLWVELGLQTINEEVAEFFHRGYPLSVYTEACSRLKKYGIKFVTHILLGLPKEKEEDGLQTALYAQECGTWGIKIHCLYIQKNTYLEQLYLNHEIKIQKKEEFVKKVVTILENLSYNIVIHRLTGDGEKETLLAPLWTLHKRDVLNSIQKKLKLREKRNKTKVVRKNECNFKTKDDA
ncbi:TIGR01212 family radical SAM protein [Fusobacterium necrophorum]|uniref:TIGR01212 family radical SAM protein n=1 Tax=Fusobacterium necrophorum TaxID=859 RepID=UPI000788DB24|nr:TIGR01212 family radical SAM protein [Fusobacterium necrophorum]KYM46615.1 radical SAM protein [Fusobacterium necrophorum subsp. funduliforme]